RALRQAPGRGAGDRAERGRAGAALLSPLRDPRDPARRPPAALAGALGRQQRALPGARASPARVSSPGVRGGRLPVRGVGLPPGPLAAALPRAERGRAAPRGERDQLVRRIAGSASTRSPTTLKAGTGRDRPLRASAPTG